jgi:hypothetical protein
MLLKDLTHYIDRMGTVNVIKILYWGKNINKVTRSTCTHTHTHTHTHTTILYPYDVCKDGKCQRRDDHA